MITTLKAATNMPEMLFLCHEYGILPVLTESAFLGLTLARVLNEQYPDKNLAVFDSGMLLEVVSYDNDDELLPYMKQKNFDVGFKVGKDGKGESIA